MGSIKEISKYILNEVKNKKMNKEEALFILKKISNEFVEKHTDIAIIGLSCQLSEANNKDEYWKNLLNGYCSIREFPDKRKKDIETLLGFNESINYSKSGYLEEIDKFDSEFFKIAPKEAILMDPFHRIYLENAYEALEDAGYGADRVYGTNTGVFVGMDHTAKIKITYLNLVEEVDLLAATGSWTGMLASRLSYLFNLNGPSEVIDTACSSGLVCVHEACKALKNGECDMAIAGGINLILNPSVDGILDSIQSGDISIRSFDRYANGTVWGEGVASVVLKTLDKAIEDRDNIYAVIKGSAVNNDGASNGITAPNALAQEDVITKAWKAANIDPRTISYIESHGTGTLLGDPIEIKGITNAFKRYTEDKQFCAIGCVKPNIGHTVAASGIAALIKVVLSMKNNVIPATINFDEPNKFINFCESPLYVNDRARSWEKAEQPRRAGIDAFGFSGTNCHVVIEEAPIILRKKDESKPFKLFTISSEYAEGITKLIDSYIECIDKGNDYDLDDLCFTANTGRKQSKYRVGIIIDGKESFEKKIRSLKNRTVMDCLHMNTEDKDKLLTEVNKRINRFLENNNKDKEALEYICQAYEKGINIPWNLFYSNEKRNKISIPTTPLKRTRCWLDVSKRRTRAMNEKNSEKEEIELEKIKLCGRENNIYTELEQSIGTIWGNVLGLNKIDIDKSFYEMGGNSIISIKIINLIEKEIGVKLQISDILNNANIKKIVHLVQTRELKDRMSQYEEIPLCDNTEYYEATSAQQRIFMLDQLDKDETAYNIPVFIMIQGNFNKDKFEEAFKKLIARHEILRTSFDFIEGRVVQRVRDTFQFQLEEIIVNSEEEMNDIIYKFIRPFNLKEDVLIRGSIININHNQNLLLIDVHHIVADGASIEIIERELISLYGGQNLGELKVNYKDYARWHNRLEQSEDLKRQEEYWINKFQDDIPVLNMPTDYPRGYTKEYEGKNIIFYSDETVLNNLNKLCLETETTLFMTLIAAFNILLSRYSNQEDIIIGTPIAGRNHPDVENLIGMFVNTIPLRFKINSGESFKDFLLRVKETSLNAYENQEYQFDKLVEKLNIHRELSRNALFDVMFVLQTMDAPTLEINNLKYIPYEYSKKISKFDLVLQVMPKESILKFDLSYCSKLYKEETIQRIASHYLNILKEIGLNPELKICDINMLSQEEKDKIINVGQGKKEFVDKVHKVNELFEKQVELTPDHIAVTAIDGTLTYKELNSRANQVARLLIKKGAKSNDIIAIISNRTSSMVVAIMGILKAGAGYLPIGIEYPTERINYMLKNSCVDIILTTEVLAENVEFTGEFIDLNDQKIKETDDGNIKTYGEQNDAAYVIYTSGSTGTPKGVMIEHRNLVNLMTALNNKIYKKFDQYLNIALLAPYVFDASIKQIFVALLNGHNLNIVPSEVRIDGVKLVKYYKDNKIDVSDGTPSYIKILSETKGCAEINVKQFIIGGEVLLAENVRKFYERFSHRIDAPCIANVYGPTECCVDTTIYMVHDDNLRNFVSIPLGNPLPNCNVYLLDTNLKPVPNGVIGEIFISGNGVGRGYLNNEGATNQSFLKDIMNPNKKMYKTGDLGLWLDDGNIQFVDRVDNQVKVRGFRIELDEIKNIILKNRAIKDAVVTIHKDRRGENYICGYVIYEDGIEEINLPDYLKRYLPEYMIPKYIVKIQQIPLTYNGKIDYKNLPNPKKVWDDKNRYVPPRNDIEKALCEICRNLLGVDEFGIEDNFFENSGDSIKAMQLISRAENCGFLLEVKQIFTYQTIKELSKVVKIGHKYIDNQLITGEIGITPLQFFLLEYGIKNAGIRNLSFMLYRKEGFGIDNIKKIFKKIIEQHDALRILFKFRDGKLIQYNRGLEDNIIEIREADLCNTSNQLEYVNLEVDKLQKGMDLTKGPLIKLILFKDNVGEHLFITINQMLIDHMSWRIILEDLTIAYMQLINNEDIKLPNKTDSFMSWSKYIYEYSTSERLLNEKEYWKKIEYSEIKNIPTDYKCDRSIARDTRLIEGYLSIEDTEELIRKVDLNKGIKIDNILLAALGLTLREIAGEFVYAVNFGNNGRDIEGCNLKINRTVGRFTSIYPILIDMSNYINIELLMNDMNQNIQSIPNKGVGYNILKYLSNSNDINYKLRPEIGFSFMGAFDQDIITDVFTISKLITGKNLSDEEPRRYKFNIVTMIKMNRLNIRIDYSSRQFKEETVVKFKNYYIENIYKMINIIKRKN
ncbi:non-ribosomal peptide synthetase [Lachnotalea glycerini]|uniref:Non-ribosomal peptide synthetase n=1 Tax=Lachnotalea glycerini TaxID=1763509 RepID=A0A371JK15_9FIRM|nr:non-ribosomal peptide synthetase [Lachnotalea glycerini]RDY33072.1 non-ribosomal peptide synthetase [Lachnotalea glycerini]